MGCKSSKAAEPKFSLTDTQRRTVQEVSQQTVVTNALLRVSVSNCAARFQGDRTRDAVMHDTHPLRHYFKDGSMPTELGDGDKSVADVVELVRRAAVDNATAKLGPELEAQHPKINSDVPLQLAARRAVEAETTSATQRHVAELIEKVLSGALRPIAPPKEIANAPVPRSDDEDEPGTRQAAGERPHAAPSPKRKKKGAAAGVAAAAPGTGPNGGDNSGPIAPASRGGGGGVVVADGVSLPRGGWIRAEGTPYYYSEAEGLYFHPASCQFYDPKNGMWYDPDQDEWYHEDE